MRIWSIVVALLVFWVSIAWADDVPDAQVDAVDEPASEAVDGAADAGSRLEEIEKVLSEAMASVPAGTTLSDEARAAIDAYTIGYYENLTIGLVHRRAVFDWQFQSSIIIFFVVIGIVLIGLYFSWIQFHAKGGDVGETTMEASKEGFKLSSPVLGVIILVLSLAFFYLYLVHVYPISELG